VRTVFIFNDFNSGINPLFNLNYFLIRKLHHFRLSDFRIINNPVCPKGSQNKEVKLTGKEDDIKKLLDKKVAVATIARISDVNRLTVRSFIKTREIG
jgi:hypothetical protein